jgi:septum formation protein
MLLRLRARRHIVLSAVVVLDPESGVRAETVCRSVVAMRDYSDDELDDYVASGDPFDKAGAYAIQHAGFHPVVDFDHCFASVRGLPLCHLQTALRRMEVFAPADVPVGCQALNRYQCPVYAGILAGGAAITVTRPSLLPAP